jgi:uncharacterized C2H2 Zn-finger protein
MNCLKCLKEFKTKQSYQSHINRKTPCVKSIIQCDNCLKIFKIIRDLTNHQNRKFKCKTVDHKLINLTSNHNMIL